MAFKNTFSKQQWSLSGTIFSYPPKERTGFTLTEIITVISIIIIISTISIPIYKQLNPNIILNTTVRNVTSDLRYAQQLAITEQTDYQVIFNPVLNSYQIKNTQISIPVKTATLNPRITISTINDLTDNTINFNITGAVTESGEITFINQSNNTATVQIKPSGYVKIKK